MEDAVVKDADELLGELFYLPYGRIWGSRWSYLHELLEGCYLPYGSLCIRVCGSFFACGECLGSSLPGFCNLCIAFLVTRGGMRILHT